MNNIKYQRCAHTSSFGWSESKLRLGLLLGASALSTTMAVTPALAQDAEREASSGNEIVVTAQRRAEQLEDVPMTITAVTAESMAQTGVVSVRDLQNVTTGFQLGQGGGYPQPAIRGVSTIVPGTSFENNVAIYIDGFYQVAPQSLNIDLPNVESVQILKGPQGTLYGRNATGGAILINTMSPKEYWEGKLELTYGRFNDRRASGYVAGPVTDSVGISLAGYAKRTDGWVRLMSRTEPGKHEGDAIPQEQDAFRAKVAADLSENFTATLGYNFSRVSSAAGNSFPTIENVGSFYSLFPAAVPLLPTKLGEYAWDVGSKTQSKQHEGTLVLELDTSIGTVKSYTGYDSTLVQGSLDFDGSYANISYNSSAARQKTFQQAVDFTVDTIANVDLTFGATYFRDKIKFVPPYIARYSGVNPFADPAIPKTMADLVQTREDRFTQDKEAWAVYADVNFHITDRLTLNLGGRYNEETIDVTGVAVSIPARTVIFPYTEKGSSYSKFTPRASLRYELAPRTNIYASYSQGFHSGAWNAGLPAQPGFWNDADQEVVDAFEVGFKTAGNTYRFELAGFYYDYTNLQVSRTETIGGSPVVQLTNAPSAEIYGIEGSFEVEVAENFNVRAGATWLHARYGDNFLWDGISVDPSRPGLNTNKDPLKTFQNIGDPNQDLSGKQMARSPNFTAHVGADYLIPNGDGGLLLAANAKYTDSYVVTNPSVWGSGLIGTQYEDRAGEQRFRQSKYVLVNASATWTDPTDTYFVRVWGNNLTDKLYRIHYNGTTFFGSYMPIGERRSYGVTVGYKFGQ